LIQTELKGTSLQIYLLTIAGISHYFESSGLSGSGKMNFLKKYATFLKNYSLSIQKIFSGGSLP